MWFREFELSDQESFLEMIADYQENDPATYNEFLVREKEWSEGEFASFINQASVLKLDWRPKAGKQSETNYGLFGEGNEILAVGRMVFPLDDKVKHFGNLFFSVPPKKRGQQLGAQVLNRMLFEAVKAGMARALVTCREDDTAARAAIEMNRGEFDGNADWEKADGSLISMSRFWINFR